MKKLLIVIICLLPFVLIFCNDKERQIIYIDQETKDYCDFKKGSWWVYKEEKTGMIDTVSVYNYENKIVSIEELSPVDFEQTRVFTIWSLYGHDLTMASPFIKIAADNGININASVEEQYPYGISYPAIIYYTLDTIGSKIKIYSSDEIKYVNYKDSIELEGKTYYKVKEFSTTAFSNKKQKSIFWAKYIGRIRFETFDGEIWNLINYHVIK